MSQYEQLSDLQIISVDGEATITMNGFYKDMSVNRFKSAVASRLRDPQATAERLMLFSLGEEMADEKTLRSFNIETGDTITYVLSGRAERPQTSHSARIPSTPKDAPPAYAYIPPTTTRVLENVFIQESDGRLHSLRKVPLSMTAKQLQAKWKENHSVELDGVRLIFGGKQLDPDKPTTLMDYGINEGSTLFAVLRMQGGVRIRVLSQLNKECGRFRMDDRAVSLAHASKIDNTMATDI